MFPAGKRDSGYLTDYKSIKDSSIINSYVKYEIMPKKAHMQVCVIMDKKIRFQRCVLSERSLSVFQIFSQVKR